MDDNSYRLGLGVLAQRLTYGVCDDFCCVREVLFGAAIYLST